MTLLLILALAGFLLAQAPAVAPVPDTFDGERFKILIVDDGLRLGEELNRYASLGYRIREVRRDSLLLERSAYSGDHHEYLVLGRDKVVTIERAMNEAATRGFRFVPRALHLEWRNSIAVIMEKAGPDGSSSRLRYRFEGADEKELASLATRGYMHVTGPIVMRPRRPQ